MEASGPSETYADLLISTTDGRDSLQSYQELSFSLQRLCNSAQDYMTTDVRLILKCRDPL
jgi:hypothetical protein